MITVHVIYDPMVFYTDKEYLRDHPGDRINIQSEVEQPEVYFLSAGSSSMEDQCALIGDRINCLLNMDEPVKTDSGIAVIHFFLQGIIPHVSSNKAPSKEVPTNMWLQ